MKIFMGEMNLLLIIRLILSTDTYTFINSALVNVIFMVTGAGCSIVEYTHLFPLSRGTFFVSLMNIKWPFLRQKRNCAKVLNLHLARWHKWKRHFSFCSFSQEYFPESSQKKVLPANQNRKTHLMCVLASVWMGARIRVCVWVCAPFVNVQIKWKAIKRGKGTGTES